MKRKLNSLSVLNQFINEPDGTDDVVHIKDIKIPPAYASSHTSLIKIKRAKEYYERNGHFDKPISVIAEVNEKGKHNILMLYDQYSRWIVAKKLKLSKVPVKYININNIEL